jgi:phage terminase small subunit
MPTSLTPTQTAFIREYLLDFNATAAAERAGYQGTRTTLANIGSRNLQKPAVRCRIDQALDGRLMPAKEVLLRLTRQARTSMADFISPDQDGQVTFDLAKALRLGAMDQVKYLAIDERPGQDDSTRRRVEVSLCDAQAALIHLARGYRLGTSSKEPFLGIEVDNATPFQKLNDEVTQDVWDVREYYLQRYGSLEAGIIASSKEIWGDDFQPSEFFMFHVFQAFDLKPTHIRNPNPSSYDHDNQDGPSAAGLTPRQEVFAIEYLVDFNATAAAQRAGYTGTSGSLAVTGTKNLQKPLIRQRISQLFQEWAMPVPEILYRLSRHARGSMADFVSLGQNGKVHFDLAKALRLGVMDQVKWLCIDERKKDGQVTRRRIEISLYDPQAALIYLARGYGTPDGLIETSTVDIKEDEPRSISEKVHFLLEAIKGLEEWQREKFSHHQNENGNLS